MLETDEPCIALMTSLASLPIHNLSAERSLPNKLNFGTFPQIRPEIDAEKVHI